MSRGRSLLKNSVVSSPLTPKSKSKMSATPPTPEMFEESTPTTSKRNCFRDESDEMNSSYYLPESQDTIYNELTGVTWSWGADSPEKKVKEKRTPVMKPKPKHVFRNSPVAVRRQPRTPKGFDRFLIELNKHIENGTISMKIPGPKPEPEPKPESSSNETKFLTAEGECISDKKASLDSIDFASEGDERFSSLPNLDTIVSNLCTSFEKQPKRDDFMRKYKSDENFVTENDLLNDSDIDMVLLQASQMAEEKIIEAKKVKEEIPTPKSVKSLKFDVQLDDSIDDLFATFPLDKIEYSKPVKAGNSSKKTTSSYIRHNSMPESPRILQPINNQNRQNILPRHISMPPSSETISISSTESLASSSTSSTSTTYYRKCTAEEIAEKRLAALAKLRINLKKKRCAK